MARVLERFVRAEAGAAAVEMALVLPAFLTLVVGGICAANLTFAIASLHYTVEDAARCAAVKTFVCGSSTATVTYAQARYRGPDIGPAFAHTTTACGHRVSATATFPLLLATERISVPLEATACFP